MISTRMPNLIMMAFPITGWSTYFLPGTDIEIIHVNFLYHIKTSNCKPLK